MLHSDLLHEFMTGFYGYGTFSAPYWFVGMEEGGGKDESTIALRLDTWNNRGRKELEDLSDFHRAMRVDKFFSENPRLQNTWKRLILVLFGIDPREAALGPAHYQGQRLGRTTGNTCLLELLPLPSPGLRHWAYDQYADRARFPYLERRRTVTASPVRRRAPDGVPADRSRHIGGFRASGFDETGNVVRQCRLQEVPIKTRGGASLDIAGLAISAKCDEHAGITGGSQSPRNLVPVQLWPARGRPSGLHP